MFSKTCEHAIKAVIFVTRQSLEGKRTNLREIATGIESPENYTAKILQLLVKNGFLLSVKGANGGFETNLDRMKALPIMRVIEAFDGDFITNGCLFGLKSCSHLAPCPIHHQYAPVRSKLTGILENTNVLDLAMGFLSGKSILKE